MSKQLQALQPRLASVLALALCAPTLAAQAGGENFHVLHNGTDVTYVGVGAGGGQTALDGLGSWVAGEDLKGSTWTSLGDWGYQFVGWRETVSILGPNNGSLAMRWPNIAFVELDGMNGHAGEVFTTPQCDPGGALLPLTSGGVIPYGGGKCLTSFSFLLAGYPSGAGLASTLHMLLPNNGLVPSSCGGTSEFVANTGDISLGVGSSGFSWTVCFTWFPSALPLHDDIDGLWRYGHNSPDNNQYWGLSNDELNSWQSQTVGVDGGCTGLLAFNANLDYCWSLKSSQPQTQDALQPAGFNGNGTYYSTTIDAGGGNPGPGLYQGVGFDLGRHLAWSMGGTVGVPNPGSGFANQDPAGAAIPSLVPSLGFATWDNADYDGDGDPVGTPPTGTWRLTWVTLDWDATFCCDPALAYDVTVAGPVRLPTTKPGCVPVWPQALTLALLSVFIHDTVNHDGTGLWPEPAGFPSGTFDHPGVNGSSVHVPLNWGSMCIGLPVAITYGTSGMGGPGGPLIWNQSIAATSDSRQLYLFD